MEWMREGGRAVSRGGGGGGRKLRNGFSRCYCAKPRTTS